HRHPEHWENPEGFDPDRFAPERAAERARCAYIPFGAGPRICIGNHFALMEAHVLLATLARRVRFDHATSAPVAYEPLVTLRPKELAMRVSLRELRAAAVA